MIIDGLFEFSDDQAITATAASTNVVDLGSDRDIGKGNPINISGKITAAFDNLTSLTIAVQTDDNEAFSSASTIRSVVMTLAELVQGADFSFIFPRANERYVRLHYTVTGTAPTTGTIAAAIVRDFQDKHKVS